MRPSIEPSHSFVIFTLLFVFTIVALIVHFGYKYLVKHYYGE
jgi:alpha-N-acetylglucosamine transferase